MYCFENYGGLIKIEVIAHMFNFGFISKHQHDFLAKHSTVTQLYECVNDWSYTLNIGHSVDVIYIDFAKAFDKVVHKNVCLNYSLTVLMV